LIYFLSVSLLGNPTGNIDTGGTWGSYSGLFLLASIYVAIGIFASVLSENQIIAFLLAMVMSFLAYIGFDFIGSLDLPAMLQSFIVNVGINEHYLSISRGVIDSRDLIYFAGIVWLFLWASELILNSRFRKWKQKSRKIVLTLIVLLIVAILSGVRIFRIDLTAEKRYSLSDASRELMKNQNDILWADIYLAGDLPPGLKVFQTSIIEKIRDFNAYSSKKIQIRIIDPYTEVPPAEREKYFGALYNRGLVPTDLRRKTDQGVETKLIFPGIIIHNTESEVALNLLKNNPMLGAEENLNRSKENLEYELARGFRALQRKVKPSVAFLTGHGESDEWETKDLEFALSENYKIHRIPTDSIYASSGKYKALIIANPSQRFSERDKFIIDQYIMKGGRVLWAVDPVNVSLDSLSYGFSTLAFYRDLNLNDQLFRYGVRLNPDLLQDAECLLIPVISEVGGQKKQEPAPWYYSPLLTPSQGHVVSRNLNRIKGEFTSSLDTVGENRNVKSHILLQTSPYACKVETPTEVSLSSINNKPDRQHFNLADIPVAVALEGQFQSVFANRIPDLGDLKAGTIIPSGVKTRMIVVADGSTITNQVIRRENAQPRILPLGYDRFSQQTFGNKDFYVNAVNYLCDDSGIMELRSRTVVLRLLDKVKVEESKLIWQLINVLVPALAFILFGLIYNFIRVRRYGKHTDS
ncbi:MAG: gliding motility-associated ABC transporter substrate-binding protein GldG, partial [Bacteroidota bacterium]|nr:gliding motility-associated ABC transporter substrate-binding protein GldG [Bacteroidota bacterium]